MTRRRNSILGLMILIFMIAVGLALPRYTIAYAEEIYSLSIGALFISVLMAIICRGRIRRFSMGFAAFGWGYLALWGSPIGTHLPTTTLFDDLYKITYGSPSLSLDFLDAMMINGEYKRTGVQFNLTAHSLTALFLGLVGGVFSRLLGSLKGDPAGESDRSSDGTLLKPGYSRELLDALWHN